MKPF
ncbi:hypothetical protein E2320_000932, partial [Naja naja]|jgi:enoyl-CoA hydratase/carnithine racemase